MLVLLALLACGKRDGEPLTADEVVDARRAMASLPAALRDLQAGRYGQAEEALAAVRSALPDAGNGATAAAVLGLAGAEEYRRLVASIETNLGLARFRARRYPSAIEALERAVRIDPRSRVAWVDLGVALFHAQRFVEASVALEQARALGAGGAHLELRAGQAAAYAGEPEAARRALQRAVRLGTTENTVGGRGTALEAQVSLAELDVAAGDLADARRRLEAVLTETPSDPLPRYRLLGVLARQGET
ncbi:MAG: tetratricopeptide repeat protein, partial [Thermoanaerobaculia bacterium]